MKKSITKLSFICLLFSFCHSCDSNNNRSADNSGTDTVLTEKKTVDHFNDSLKRQIHQRDSLFCIEVNRRFKNSSSKDTLLDGFYIMRPNDLIYILDTLGLKEMYEDAKWRMYCVRCDRKVHYTQAAKTQCKLPDSLTYGELNLELSSVRKVPLHNAYYPKLSLPDSLYFGFELFFCFDFKKMNCQLFEKPIYLDQESKQAFSLIYGEKYPQEPLSESKGGLLYYTFHRWFNLKTKAEIGKVRIYTPLQPEVIYYVRTHVDKMDPWFHNEAIKRGLFDSSLFPPEKILKQIKQNKRTKEIYIDTVY